MLDEEDNGLNLIGMVHAYFRLRQGSHETGGRFLFSTLAEIVSIILSKCTFIRNTSKWYCTYFNAKFGEEFAYLVTEMLVGIPARGY